MHPKLNSSCQNNSSMDVRKCIMHLSKKKKELPTPENKWEEKKLLYKKRIETYL